MGALIWHKAVFTQKHVDELAKFQRFALMQLGYFRLNTPGAALEVVSNTMPLDLYIMYDAVCSYIRTRGHEKYTPQEMHATKTCLKGHRQTLVEFAEKLGFAHLLDEQVDDMVAQYNWDNKFTIDKYSWSPNNPKRGIPKLDSDCNIYTDGSYLGEHRSGAGVSVWKTIDYNGHAMEIPFSSQGQDHSKRSFYLEDCGIFLEENFGANDAGNWLTEFADDSGIRRAVVNIDSTSDIQALGNHKIKSKTVFKAVQTLNNAARIVDNLTIRWVKAHQDDSILHRGNYFADKLAKDGAEANTLRTLVHPNDIPLPSLASVKTKIYGHLKQEWTRRWLNPKPTQAKCRQTKHWFPTPNPLRSFQLISGRSRYEYSVLLHAITGHNHLAYHENKHDPQLSPMCTVCNVEGTLMTTQHLFTECEALVRERLSIFGRHQLEFPYTFSIPAAIRFLRETGDKIGWLPVDEFRD